MASKKQNQPLVQCATCKHSDLHQWEKYNPIIAHCKKNNSKEVANQKRICESYEFTDTKFVIRHEDI